MVSQAIAIRARARTSPTRFAPDVLGFDGARSRFIDHFRACFIDHAHGDPPHFHVETNEARALIRIADLQVIRGSVRGPDMLSIEQWARRHQAELALNWVFARAKLELREIPYP